MELQYINESKTCRVVEGNGIPYITFPKLSRYEDDMIHGFSTRLGGVSTEYLASMNLSFSRGDNRENVMENHRRFAAALGYDEKKLVFSDQVHSTRFHRVTREDCGKGIVRDSDIKEIDGLVTDEPGVPIITFYADCVPLFFYDPVKKVIAMAHSGWRGSVERIGAKMAAYMEQEYNCKSEDILCAIGPSICQRCYEVSEDVAEKFIEEFGYGKPRKIHDKERAGCAPDDLLWAKADGKYQLNLHRACEIALLEAGIRRENLDVTDLCTCCNPQFFYSHRASQGKRGNLAGVMMIKEND